MKDRISEENNGITPPDRETETSSHRSMTRKLPAMRFSFPQQLITQGEKPTSCHPIRTTTSRYSLT